MVFDCRAIACRCTYCRCNMACGRPGGFSDSEDSDEDFFFDKPNVRAQYYPVNNHNEDSRQAIEKALQAAIAAGDLDKTRNIIHTKLKGDINSRLSNSWTPLLHACFDAQDDIVEHLLQSGADANLHGDSVTPLMAACSNEAADEEVVLSIVCRLLEKGAILNLGDKYGNTGLMRAVINGRAAVVRELLKHEINIEMRDLQGWTAVFWAVHHNRVEILELLVAKNARLTELDKSGRTALEIAQSHNHQDIIDILKQHLDVDEEEPANVEIDFCDWRDYYPGVKNNQPNYADEIRHFLYAMRCENLQPIFTQNGIGLKTFLLLDEEGMIKLGIDLPFERKRLKLGLSKFHRKGWKVEAVAGLYVQKNEKTFSMLDCLSILGSHLQQLCILDATVHYAMRQPRVTTAPHDSPELGVIKAESAKIVESIRGIRREIDAMKAILTKISDKNPRPADLIRKTPPSPGLLSTMTKCVIVFSIGGFIYINRGTITSAILKR